MGSPLSLIQLTGGQSAELRARNKERTPFCIYLQISTFFRKQEVINLVLKSKAKKQVSIKSLLCPISFLQVIHLAWNQGYYFNLIKYPIVSHQNNYIKVVVVVVLLN